MLTKWSCIYSYSIDPKNHVRGLPVLKVKSYWYSNRKTLLQYIAWRKCFIRKNSAKFSSALLGQKSWSENKMENKLIPWRRRHFPHCRFVCSWGQKPIKHRIWEKDSVWHNSHCNCKVSLQVFVQKNGKIAQVTL